jgi:hypothetical protein
VVKHQLLVEQEIHLPLVHLKEMLVEEVHQETVEKVVVEQLQLEEHPRQIMEAVELEVQVHQMQSQE